MFSKILAWIREVINKMIGQSTVKQALKVDIALSSVMASALQTWSQMYEDQADWLTTDIVSLSLPAAIASEIARAVTIEMQVEFTGSARAKYLEAQYADVAAKLREQVEKGVAKGGLMLKPYISGDRIYVDFVQADQFYPVAFDANGNITSCVFADQRTIGDKYYTRLEYHAMTENGVEIRNLAFKSPTRDSLGQSVPLTDIEAWRDLLPEALITGVDKPLYAYFRYPLANNIDINSPLGVSCYSRAVKQIEQADKLWSNLLWEFESGKRAVYVDELAFTRDSLGNVILPDLRLYRTLKTGGTEDDFFEAWSPEFREASIQSGLDTILKKIEFNCGLAYGTLSDPQSIEKTATEIVSAKQRSYATVADTQKALQIALEQLIWVMDIWATIGGLAPAGAYQTAMTFDDSLIVDRDMQFKQDLQLVGTGIMSKVEWRMRNFGEKEEVAKAKIAAVQAEQPQDMFADANR